MREGQIIAGRFELLKLAGTGGMGSVYRARDVQTQQEVAVKVLRESAAMQADRFLLEAKVLAELQHPGVVRYVAHGATPSGELYLAMEWLEGEDLGQRLARMGLTPAESVEVALQVANTLGVAHGRGIVHRDIKPSNLFLVHKSLTQVKVLDFGVARLTRAGVHSTRSGVMVGTPGYMAPEQARGEKTIDARADVFSLGCVLFECLIGYAPFSGDNAIAVLAKILLDEAPSILESRPDLPPDLDRTVATLLSKDPAGRPLDGAGAALLLGPVLQSLGSSGKRTITSERPATLTTGEKRLVSVVLSAEKGALERLEVATLAPGRMTEPGGNSTDLRPARFEALRAAVEALGGQLEPIADGALVITVVGSKVATDQAARAGRCALAVRGFLPGAPIAVATGRGVLTGRWPLGEVIDRASGMLRDVSVVAAGAAAPMAAAIRIDELTAGLLGPAFEVAPGEGGLQLRGVRIQSEASRVLLGKPTPCVGRDRELAHLEGVLDEAVSEPVARAVVITGSPGVGKSRLRDEFIARVRARNESLELWTARGDPMRAGAPFGLLSQVIRQVTGIAEGEAAAEAQRHIRARVSQVMQGPELDRVAEFLCELAATPLVGGESVQLLAARRDSMLMGDQLRRAFEDWMAAECKRHPVLLILDDLHWGDLPTTRFVDSALRKLEDAPLMVLALARPEVTDLFPKLWADRGAEEIRLRELTRKSAEKLVRSVLGVTVSEADVARIVERADGNAFFLEELVRAIAGGTAEALPATVVAMVQSRLEGIDAPTRRAMRAASVFGRVFWKGGVFALLGGTGHTNELGDALGRLVELEVCEVRGASHFKGEEELAFRHALLHEASYQMLTDADRVLGHKLAAKWLRQAGETNPLVLAEHLEKGGAPLEAVDCYRRAAIQALEGNDFASTIARCERGAACGASGEVLAELRCLQAEAHKWLGEPGQAARRAGEAMFLAPRGSDLFYRAAAEAGVGWSRVGDRQALAQLAHEILRPEYVDPANPSYVMAVSLIAWPQYTCGQNALGDALLDTVQGKVDGLAASDGRVSAALAEAEATRAMLAGDLEVWIEMEEQGVNAFQAMGDLRNACQERNSWGYALAVAGQYQRSLEVLQASRIDAQRMGLPNVAATSDQNIGLALWRLGRYQEALETLQRSRSAFTRSNDRRMEGGTLQYIARVCLELGDLPTALQSAREALGLLTESRSLQTVGHATLAMVLLKSGQLAPARAEAQQAATMLAELGEIEEGEPLVGLVEAETLHALGRLDEAKAAIGRARARLEAQAAKMSTAEMRFSFLTNISEHARIIGLSTEWA